MQQTAKLLHRQKLSRVLLKLDISKAFDSVSWAFLLEVLTRLGFGFKWRTAICNLLSSSSTRVLLNGDPGRVITHRRGLRQEDPLSPMLFIIAMDVLSSLVAKADDLRLLEPLVTKPLSHRMYIYADDVILFANSFPTDMNLIKKLLQCFGEASGLKTNMAKSCCRSAARRIRLVRSGKRWTVKSRPSRASIWGYRCR